MVEAPWDDRDMGSCVKVQQPSYGMSAKFQKGGKTYDSSQCEEPEEMMYWLASVTYIIDYLQTSLNICVSKPAGFI
jgi:hypothetical protein